MPGDIRAKGRAVLPLVTSGAALTNNSAVAAATDLGVNAGGNAAEDFISQFWLSVQWASVSGMTAGMIAAELYLVPSQDGVVFPDVNLTGGSSRVPFATLAGVFELPLVPAVNTNIRLVTRTVDLLPLLYRAYILNKSGQSFNTGWTLHGVSAAAQYL